MNQPIMMGPMGPPPLIRQNAVPNFNMPIQNKKTNPIIGIVVVLILCIIIWLVFLKKNGSHSKWSEWSTCDKECGGGQETRTRKYTPAEWGGTDLEDKDHIIEYKECNKDPCPIDGSFSEWSNWSSCNKECGGGTQSRSRTYTGPKYGGQDLSDKNKIKESRECNTDPCENDPAKVTPWEDIKDSNGNIIYYDDKTENSNIVDINKLSPHIITIYKKQQKTFTKEGSKYTGTEKLEKILSDLLDKKEITELDKNNLISNNGGELTKYKEEDKNKYKYISDLQWNSNDFSECSPEKGFDRWQEKNGIYYFPTGNNEHDSTFPIGLFASDTWNSINNLLENYSHDEVKDLNNIYKFTRKNTNTPKKYEVQHKIKCDSIPWYTLDQLKSIWKASGPNRPNCSTDLTDNIMASISGGKPLEDYMQSQSGETDFINHIKNWTRPEIIKLNNISNKITRIQECYGKDKNTPITNVNQNENSNALNKSILYPGLSYSKGTEWSNGNHKLKFQMDDNLVLYINGHSAATWETSDKTMGKNADRLAMQIDGNLVIYDKFGDAVWSSGTFNNHGAYAELLSNGNFVIKKDNKIIRYLLTKKYGNKNIYFSGEKNWKYCKNNASPDGILKDWSYIPANGTDYKYIEGRVTLIGDNQPWGMTEQNTTDDERSKSGMIKPIKISQVNEPKDIVHVVLMNKLGQRIYIEPQLLLDIYNKNDKTDDIDETIHCKLDNKNPVNAYNIDKNDFINKLKTSSDKLTDGLFRNEWGNGDRDPFRFYKNSGAWADPNDRHESNKNGTCSEWYLVAFDGNSQWGKTYKTQKDALEKDGFKKARNNIKFPENWLRDPRGRGEATYSVYWRVYYRTQEDYVNYLNGPDSPNAPAFTNKSIFENKCINDLEYFVNYRIKQKNKSNFSNKLNNAYLEAIM